MEHPFFWNGEKAVAFITNIVDNVLKPIMASKTEAINETGENEILKQLAEIERPIIRGFWNQYLTPGVRALCDRKSYDAKSLVTQFLMYFITIVV